MSNNEKDEAAKVLGWESEEQMMRMQKKTYRIKSDFESEKKYQQTHEAQRRREVAGVNSDTWVEIPKKMARKKLTSGLSI